MNPFEKRLMRENLRLRSWIEENFLGIFTTTEGKLIATFCQICGEQWVGLKPKHEKDCILYVNYSL